MPTALSTIRCPLYAGTTRTAYVRFTPESGHWLSVSGCPLCAKSGLMQRSKKDRYSPRSIRVVRLVLLRRHYCLGRLFGLKGVDQDLGGRSGRGRVLTGDQQSVGDDVDTPVFDLGESGTEAEQLVLDTSSSSPSVNPVTFLPSTSGFPAAVFTWRRTPGAWQTSATGFPAARNDSISLMELGSSARSHIGPWPPG